MSQVGSLQAQLEVATELKGQFYMEAEELRNQLRQAQQAQQGGKKDESTCVVCMDNRVECALLPCFHAQFCMECAGALMAAKAQCAVCRCKVTGAQQIFL